MTFPICYVMALVIIKQQVYIYTYPTLLTVLSCASHEGLYLFCHVYDLQRCQRRRGKAKAIEKAGTADADRLRGQHTAETYVAEQTTQDVARLTDIGGSINIGA